MKLLGRAGAVVAFCIAASLCTLPVGAEDVLTTIGVGDTILEVSGKTSPHAFVTISRDGSVIGTQTANSAGTFSQTFTAQQPGLHQLSLYAHTPGGENTDTITATVNVGEHTTTTVQFFLPSTLRLSDSSLLGGQPLGLSGATAPSSIVTIYIDNSNYATATSNDQGDWSADINTSALSKGQHDVFVKAADSFGMQSYPTSPQSFSIETKSSPRPIPGVISPGQPQKTPGQAPAPPTITFPRPGTTWRQSAITVMGHADAHVQIQLWNEGRIIASVWSDSRGVWSVNLPLESKDYSLRARACLEGMCSGFSSTVHFSVRIPQQEEPITVWPSIFLALLLMIFTSLLLLRWRQSYRTRLPRKD